MFARLNYEMKNGKITQKDINEIHKYLCTSYGETTTVDAKNNEWLKEIIQERIQLTQEFKAEYERHKSVSAKYKQVIQAYLQQFPDEECHEEKQEIRQTQMPSRTRQEHNMMKSKLQPQVGHGWNNWLQGESHYTSNRKNDGQRNTTYNTHGEHKHDRRREPSNNENSSHENRNYSNGQKDEWYKDGSNKQYTKHENQNSNGHGSNGNSWPDWNNHSQKDGSNKQYTKHENQNSNGHGSNGNSRYDYNNDSQKDGSNKQYTKHENQNTSEQEWYEQNNDNSGNQKYKNEANHQNNAYYSQGNHENNSHRVNLSTYVGQARQGDYGNE